MQEIWKDINGYVGFYQISSFGNVRRITKDGYRNVKARDGIYYTVSLSKNCNKKTFANHRLVAEHFIPNPNDIKEVNHKDGNKHNNCIDNLEWVSQTDNRKHAIKQLSKNPFGKAPRAVMKIDKETDEVVEIFESVADASRAIGSMSARSSITYCCQGYMKSAYGYKWKYAN